LNGSAAHPRQIAPVQDVTLFRNAEPPLDAVLAVFAVSAGILATASAVSHHWWPLGRAGIGVAAMLAFYLAIRLIDPIALGYGDVLLAGVVGGFLGYTSWAALVVGTFLSYLLADAGIVAVMRLRRWPNRAGIPFSPFVVAGAIVALVVADPIAQAYLDFARRG
jgi:leader peptidase (prepilin peptidase) / N-methyltransferase